MTIVAPLTVYIKRNELNESFKLEKHEKEAISRDDNQEVLMIIWKVALNIKSLRFIK